MPPKTPPQLIQQEKAALAKVKVVQFGANPRSVKTFGKTEVAWKVEVPVSDIDISLELNKAPVPAEGKQSFTLNQSLTFTLLAVTENTGRKLRTVTVQVDASECQQKNFDAFLVSSMFKSEFDRRFSGSTQLTLRGKKTQVTLGGGTITIAVPLSINVPNFFDAKMDISIVLGASGGGSVVVSTQSVNIDVSWSLLAHLTSLGCTGFVQAGLEQMAKAFLTNIVQSEVEPRLEKEFTKLATDFTEGLKAADPSKRTYAMTRFQVDENGITITACPK